MSVFISRDEKKEIQSVDTDQKISGAISYILDMEVDSAKLKEKGLCVAYPLENELQIDIDSVFALENFWQRFAQLQDMVRKGDWKGEKLKDIGKAKVTQSPSKSGHPHYHMVVSFPDSVFTSEERILLQLILGSDYTREVLSAVRNFAGVKQPTRFFEELP
jgi:hypothetical protein